MPYLEQLGMQAGEQALNGIMGIALGAYNDKRQLKQQQKLQNMQIEGSKTLTDYNAAKQLEMWHATNYGPQMQELEKAGLNPGLIYGMGGGGGASANIESGSVQGANAPAGGREIMDMMNNALQRKMTEAQTKVLESQAKLNEVEANKKAGVDTKVGEATIANLTQDVTNKKAQEALTRVQTEAQELQNEINGSAINDIKGTIKYAMRKIYGEMQSALAQGTIDEATIKEKTRIVQEEMIQSVLKNALTKADIANVKADTAIKEKTPQVLDAQLKKWANEIMIAWDKLANETTINSQNLRDAMGDSDFPKELTEIISQAVDGIMRRPDTKKPNKIGFK